MAGSDDTSNTCTEPYGPVPRTPRLNTAQAVRREVGQVYRRARAGQMPWEAATRATYVLFALYRMIDAATLDQLAERVARLEAAGPRP